MTSSAVDFSLLTFVAISLQVGMEEKNNGSYDNLI
jgi:hypothetical protein